MKRARKTVSYDIRDLPNFYLARFYNTTGKTISTTSRTFLLPNNVQTSTLYRDFFSQYQIMGVNRRAQKNQGVEGEFGEWRYAKGRVHWVRGGWYLEEERKRGRNALCMISYESSFFYSSYLSYGQVVIQFPYLIL